MENVNIKLENNKAIIEIDLTKELGPSASGKSVVIATTRGNVPIPGAETYKLGVNCYRPRPRE